MPSTEPVHIEMLYLCIERSLLWYCEHVVGKSEETITKPNQLTGGLARINDEMIGQCPWSQLDMLRVMLVASGKTLSRCLRILVRQTSQGVVGGENECIGLEEGAVHKALASFKDW